MTLKALAFLRFEKLFFSFSFEDSLRALSRYSCIYQRGRFLSCLCNVFTQQNCLWKHKALCFR